jgi:hypothetical protein
MEKESSKGGIKWRHTTQRWTRLINADRSGRMVTRRWTELHSKRSRETEWRQTERQTRVDSDKSICPREWPCALITWLQQWIADKTGNVGWVSPAAVFGSQSYWAGLHILFLIDTNELRAENPIRTAILEGSGKNCMLISIPCQTKKQHLYSLDTKNLTITNNCKK